MPTTVELEEEVGLAEAIFDNEAEWPDELVFRRGDILHVLDQQPAGGLADGWWLCADKEGRRGIAPANRLKMIHTFGQGRNRVITPRRFGDVFLYNHRLFDGSDDDFFRQPPVASLFNSVYDVPTALRNLYLLHASDQPFVLGDKIGNSGSSSRDNSIAGRNGQGGSNGDGEKRQPIVRNVPIRLEKRGEADGALKTLDDGQLQMTGTATVIGNNAHRSRSPPPPPPQRRHFNLTGPLLLSSLVNAPVTSSTSSSGSDEERIGITSGESSQVSPNANAAVSVNPKRDVDPTSNRQTSTSLYDSPSSLLISTSQISQKLSPSRSADASLSPSLFRKNVEEQLNSRLGTSTTTKEPVISNGAGVNMPSSLQRSGINELDSILSMYDVPRTLRDREAPTAATLASRFQNHSSVDEGSGAAASKTGYSMNIISNNAASKEENRSGHDGITERSFLSTSKPFSMSTMHGRKLAGETEAAERLSISSMDSKSSDYQDLLSGSSELRLSAAVAMDTLIKLLENLQATVDKLTGYITRNWRRHDYLESHVSDIRSSCRQTVAALKDFFDFSSGAFVNVNRIVVSNANTSSSNAAALNSADGRVSKHLAHLVKPLNDSLRLLIKLQQNLDISGWIPSKLIREGAGNDSLDQFVAVANQVPQDARQVASFIHGNISLIFPPASLNSFNSTATSSRILSVNGSSSTNSQQNSTASSSPLQQQLTSHPRTVRFSDDVHVSTGEVTTINGSGDESISSTGSLNGLKSNRTLSNGAGSTEIQNHSSVAETSTDNGSISDMRRSIFDDYDYVEAPIRSSTQSGHVNGTPESVLPTEDRQILQFYSPQVENHIACLSNAIDDFLSAVEQNEPPKVFVGHSKFVILGAHKLVYIGDSIAQCIRKRELGDRVKQCADHLCEVLKYCVTATKQAALQYPSVPCVQAMVDSMVNVSHAAYELKLLIQEAANL